MIWSNYFNWTEIKNNFLGLVVVKVRLKGFTLSSALIRFTVVLNKD